MFRVYERDGKTKKTKSMQLMRIKSIAAGTHHAAMVDEMGRVFTWGAGRTVFCLLAATHLSMGEGVSVGIQLYISIFKSKVYKKFISLEGIFSRSELSSSKIVTNLPWTYGKLHCKENHNFLAVIKIF